MRTTLRIPDPLLDQAKRAAAARGVTLSDVVSDALRKAFEQGQEASSAPTFELVTFRGSAAWPPLDFDRGSALIAAEDESRYRVAELPEAYRKGAPAKAAPRRTSARSKSKAKRSK